MKNKKLHSAFLAVALALGLVATGCLLSGQFIILYDMDANVHSSDNVLGSAHIDLTTEDIWKDHSDKIQGITDVKFEAKFVNNTSTEASGEVWVSLDEYSTVAQVETPGNATRILSGITVPGSGETDISFAQSSEKIENLETLLDLVEEGEFWVYGIAADVPFDITITGIDSSDPDKEHARFLVTITAGP